MVSSDDKGFFHRLNLDYLQAYARKHWVNLYNPPLTRITLHYFDNKFIEKYLYSRSKYAVLFHWSKPETVEEHEAFREFVIDITSENFVVEEFVNQKQKGTQALPFDNVNRILGIDGSFSDVAQSSIRQP